MRPKLNLVTILLCFNQVLGIQFVEQFYDDADVQCAKIVHFPKENFNDLFNAKMQLAMPNNQTVIEYTKCWMYHEGLIDSKGDIKMDNFNNWATTLAFSFVAKDLKKYSVDKRKDIVNKVLGECKEKLSFSSNISGMETVFFNCFIGGVYDA